MKKLKKSMVIVLTLLVVLGNTLVVSASNTGDVMQPYQNRLNEINEKLGTNYDLASEEDLNSRGLSISDQIDFFTKMDLDEFEDYIMELHNNSEIVEPAVSREDTGIMTLADETIQRAYYDNVHWFYLASKIVTINNVVYYNSFLSAGAGEDKQNVYPQYEINSTTHSVSTDSRKMDVTYGCRKLLSEYVVDSRYYSITHTYTAGEN